jgi:adenosylcobinamide-GDP ribazoletransferase
MSDVPPPPDARLRDDERPSPLTALLTAVQFLLISPAFIKRPFSARELGAAVGFYPLVGLTLGGLLLAADYLLAFFLPPLVRLALILALWVILTGALHLDGFLDACDGLLGGFTPESRLEIMRDERVGAFALAGGVLLLLVKFSALTAAIPIAPVLLLAPVLGRWGMALALVAFPYARPQGLGKAVKDNATWRQAVIATGFALLISLAIAWWWGDWRVLLAWIAAGLVVWVGAKYTLRRIPGLTGDIYGALNEIIEVTVLLVLAVNVR